MIEFLQGVDKMVFINVPQNPCPVPTIYALSIIISTPLVFCFLSVPMNFYIFIAFSQGKERRGKGQHVGYRTIASGKGSTQHSKLNDQISTPPGGVPNTKGAESHSSEMRGRDQGKNTQA